MKHVISRHSVRLASLPAGIALALLPALGNAQETSPQPADDTTTLDRIEVTGSRIKRADIETSQPIFSLSREDIQAQGLTSVGDVIQNLTAQGSALNSTFNNGGNGETQVNLRNLGANRTLVLVNGRRWVGGTGLGGPVDLNTIPTAAVERIEVLKDGASTIYGSDAIAGVVNIILRQNFDGAEANAYLGGFDKGDGTRQSYDFTVGSTGDRWATMLGIGYVKEEPVMAGDREISAVPRFGASEGFGGSFTTPQGRFQSLANSTNPDDDYGFAIPDPTDPRGWREDRGTVDNYNFAPDNYLLTPQERKSVFANGSLDITDNLRFKTTVTYNQRVSEQLLAANPIAGVVVSEDNIYNPYGEDLLVYRRPNETGGRSFNQDVKTFVFNGVLEGTFNIADKPFDWEGGMFYGDNKSNDTTTGLFQLSRINSGLGPSMLDGAGNPVCVTTPGDLTTVIAGCVPLDFLHGEGTLTPEMIEYMSFTAHDEFYYQQKTYYANVGGDLFDLPGGPLAFSFGLERRDESGYDSPDALINAGDTTGNRRTATSGGYSVQEAYLELAIPVLADLPFAKLLDFSVATRYSDYSTFGDTLNSKFGFRWKPIDDLLVRGNWSEGFRAPSISELFSGQGDSFPQLGDPCAATIQGLPNAPPPGCASVPAYNQINPQIRITVGGNPDLTPETSTSKTLGFVYSPGWAEGLDISLDWWQIEIETAIVIQSPQSVLDGCYRSGVQANCDQIFRNPDGSISDLLAIPQNIGTYASEGWDMTVGYRLPETSFGKFSVTWDTTYLSEVTTDLNGDGLITEDPISGEGGNQVGEYYGTGANNWRIRSNVALRWELGDWGATWFSRYYSSQEEFCEPPTVPAAERDALCSDTTRITNLDGNDPDLLPDGPVLRAQNHIPSRVYHDASVFWKTPWNAKITVGINNLFDQDPPLSATAGNNSFDPAYDVPGRFYYLSYNQKF